MEVGDENTADNLILGLVGYMMHDIIMIEGCSLGAGRLIVAGQKEGQAILDNRKQDTLMSSGCYGNVLRSIMSDQLFFDGFAQLGTSW